jgi:hypothetical protein
LTRVANLTGVATSGPAYSARGRQHARHRLSEGLTLCRSGRPHRAGKDPVGTPAFAGQALGDLRSVRPASGRRGALADARAGEVGQACRTEEVFEQGTALGGGEDGGKAPSRGMGPPTPNGATVSPGTRARCGKAARRNLRGGLVVAPVPTGTSRNARPLFEPGGGLAAVSQEIGSNTRQSFRDGSQGRARYL